ncbi:MAG: nuclear transport factor 2 family protein, partial [Gemmataceae bacterium]
PSYMAPEQAGGKTREVGPACDIWALGAILYECLTGRPPFRAATALDTVMQVIGDDPVAPSRLNARTPRDLETITLKCLQKESKRRYATAADLADDLGRFLADEPIRARPVGAFERVVKWVRRRPAVAGLLLLAAILTAAGVGGVLHEWRRAEGERDQAERQRDLARQASREASERAEAEARAVTEADAARRQAEERRLVTERLLRDARHGKYFFDVLRAQRDLKAGLPDSADALLSNCPLDLRGWEWHHLARLCHLDSVPCVGHQGDGWAVAWAPDGKALASGGMDGTVRFWDPATGRQTKLLKGHKGWVSHVSFSPDGRRLASGSMIFSNAVFAATGDWEKSTTGEVIVWDVASGRELRRFPGGISALFSPDGKRLGFPSGRQAKVADVETGQELATITGHTLPVFAAAFTPDGKKVITMAYDAGKVPGEAWSSPEPIRVGGELKVWDAASGKPAGPPLAQPKHGVHTVKFHPDGKRLVGSSLDGSVLVWDLTTGKTLHTIESRGVRSVAVCLTPDDRLLVPYMDRRAILYDLDSAAPVGTVLGPAHYSALSPDGRWLATTGTNGDPVRVFDLRRAGDASRRFDLPGLVASCEFSPDGERLALVPQGQVERRLRLLDVKTLKEIANEPSLGTCLAWSSDGKRLVTGGTKPAGLFRFAELSVRDGATGKELFPLKGPGERVASLGLSADGRWLASSISNFRNQPWMVLVWDLSKGQRADYREFSVKNVGIDSVAISPDGRLVAAACRDRSVRVWDRETGRQRLELIGHDHSVKSVVFHPGGRQLASGGFDGKIVLWDVVKGVKLHELRGHRQAETANNAGITTLAYSPDGRRLASASLHDSVRGEVKVWDTSTGVEAYSLDGKRAVAFSPDGSRVAAGAGGGAEPWQLRVWDATPRPEVGVRQAHVGPIRAISASRDGKRFVTASDDGTARVWDAVTGEMLQTVGKQSSIVWHAALSPDGQRLATGGGDKSVRVYRLDTGEQVLALTGHERVVRQVAWLDGDRLASVSEDQTARIWDLKTGNSVRTLRLGNVGLALDVSPDGKRLLVGAAVLTVFDTQTWEELLVCNDIHESVHSVAFRPDGQRFASVDFGGRLRVFDSETGRQLMVAEPLPSWLFGVGWSRDGKYLATGGDNPRVRVYDAENGGLVATLTGHSSWVAGLACLENDLIATGGNFGELRLWRFPRGGEVAAVPPARSFPENESHLGRLARQLHAAGKHAEALDVLRRWEAASSHLRGTTQPSCVGLSALTLDALGRRPEALARLAELRELMRHEWCASDKEVAELFEQAKARLGEPKLDPAEEEVRAAVFKANEAGFQRNDVDGYLELWAPRSKYVGGRGEAPGPEDVVRERAAMEPFLKLWFAGNPAGLRRTFLIDEVKFQGDAAAVRMSNTLRVPRGYFRFRMTFRLAKTSAGWKAVEGRYWSEKRRDNDNDTTFDAALWKRRDEQVELARQEGDLRAERDALFQGDRYREAHEASKRLTAKADAAAQDWASRANCALHANDLADTAYAAKQARRRDPKVQLNPSLEAAAKAP